MTESLKMWRILSNKTNAFNKHVKCNKNIYLTVLHVMEAALRYTFSMRCFLNEKVLQTNDETQWNPYRFVVHV